MDSWEQSEIRTDRDQATREFGRSPRPATVTVGYHDYHYRICAQGIKSYTAKLRMRGVVGKLLQEGQDTTPILHTGPVCDSPGEGKREYSQQG